MNLPPGFIRILSIAAVALLGDALIANANGTERPTGRQIVSADSGQRFQLDCAGDGAMTVIFDGGHNHWSLHYADLLQRMAQLTHSCLFDRPGYGNSSPGNFPRSFQQNAEDLARMLDAAGIDTPVVLAGHSLGGLNVLSFAALFRVRVAGIVLIDSAHPDQHSRLPPALVTGLRQTETRLWRHAALLGIGETVDVVQDAAPWLRPEIQRQIEADLARATSYATAASELASMAGAGSLLKSRLAQPLDLPLVVLTAKSSFAWFGDLERHAVLARAQQEWLAMQTELLEYSEQSTQKFSEGHHALQISDPESIVAAIRVVMEQLDAGTR